MEVQEVCFLQAIRLDQAILAHLIRLATCCARPGLRIRGIRGIRGIRHRRPRAMIPMPIGGMRYHRHPAWT